ncbi:MAG: CocE/NonD family hydrolase, partial [Gemmatimonadaceae bacterium]|nr:CocE/NonD family hydrolase [Gemmatimonadaceae bacterium]
MNRTAARSAVLLAFALAACASPALAQRGRGNVDTAAINAVQRAYEKLDVKIPMRDGVKLFTTIYVPRDSSRKYPFLMNRTPYGIGAPGGPYRPTLGLGQRYMDAGMIFVYQDARGRYYSEGEFTEMTPHKDRKGPKDVDESTDSYDTIDWLVNNVRSNNGRVGIYGTSYPGFYTTASCIDPHPALKACAPGSPMTDLWNGDDLFHNGAFYLGANFSFYQGFGRTPRNPQLGPDPSYPESRPNTGNDAYAFFLAMGPVGPGSRKYLPRETAPLWDIVLQHPAYDAFWQARDIRRHLRRTAPAMLEIGGFYDAEDLFGPFGTFRAIEQIGDATSRAGNHLAMGPWAHGGWARGDGDQIGTLRWNVKTGPWFRDSIEFPFFMHHLADGPDPKLPKVLIYRTGANQWDRYDVFPPPSAAKQSLYLQPGGKLSFSAPAAGAGYDEYVSDPADPVPVVGRKDPSGMPRDYMVGDQRFASDRYDVLTYVSDVLTDDVTIAGPVAPVLHVATSGTDADFDVKLIDVWPADAPNWPGDSSGFQVAGYQQLVRGEPFRGRYRRAPDKPVAFVPNRPDSLRFEMPDINHTFRKGHRIMVQVQSSWVPLTDRNPQTFVPNIFEASPSDFVKAPMRVYHEPQRASRLEVR